MFKQNEFMERRLVWMTVGEIAPNPYLEETEKPSETGDGDEHRRGVDRAVSACQVGKKLSEHAPIRLNEECDVMHPEMGRRLKSMPPLTFSEDALKDQDKMKSELTAHLGNNLTKVKGDYQDLVGNIIKSLEVYDLSELKSLKIEDGYWMIDGKKDYVIHPSVKSYENKANHDQRLKDIKVFIDEVNQNEIEDAEMISVDEPLSETLRFHIAKRFVNNVAETILEVDDIENQIASYIMTANIDDSSNILRDQLIASYNKVKGPYKVESVKIVQGKWMMEIANMGDNNVFEAPLTEDVALYLDYLKYENDLDEVSNEAADDSETDEEGPERKAKRRVDRYADTYVAVKNFVSFESDVDSKKIHVQTEYLEAYHELMKLNKNPDQKVSFRIAFGDPGNELDCEASSYLRGNQRVVEIKWEGGRHVFASDNRDALPISRIFEAMNNGRMLMELQQRNLKVPTLFQQNEIEFAMPGHDDNSKPEFQLTALPHGRIAIKAEGRWVNGARQKDVYECTAADFTDMVRKVRRIKGSVIEAKKGRKHFKAEAKLSKGKLEAKASSSDKQRKIKAEELNAREFDNGPEAFKTLAKSMDIVIGNIEEVKTVEYADGSTDPESGFVYRNQKLDAERNSYQRANYQAYELRLEWLSRLMPRQKFYLMKQENPESPSRGMEVDFPYVLAFGDPYSTIGRAKSLEGAFKLINEQKRNLISETGYQKTVEYVNDRLNEVDVELAEGIEVEAIGSRKESKDGIYPVKAENIILSNGPGTERFLLNVEDPNSLEAGVREGYLLSKGEKAEAETAKDEEKSLPEKPQRITVPGFDLYDENREEMTDYNKGVYEMASGLNAFIESNAKQITSKMNWPFINKDRESVAAYLKAYALDMSEVSEEAVRTRMQEAMAELIGKELEGDNDAVKITFFVKELKELRESQDVKQSENAMMSLYVSFVRYESAQDNKKYDSSNLFLQLEHVKDVNIMAAIIAKIKGIDAVADDVEPKTLNEREFANEYIKEVVRVAALIVKDNPDITISEFQKVFVDSTLSPSQYVQIWKEEAEIAKYNKLKADAEAKEASKVNGLSFDELMGRLDQGQLEDDSKELVTHARDLFVEYVDEIGEIEAADIDKNGQNGVLYLNVTFGDAPYLKKITLGIHKGGFYSFAKNHDNPNEQDRLAYQNKYKDSKWGGGKRLISDIDRKL